MPFRSLIKGRVAESLIATLLERAGYRVTRFGVEELLGEVKLLSHDQYRALSLPDALRTLPDLLVTTATVSRAWLVEVKFRRSFDRESALSLYDSLRRQREFWPESFAVIAIGDPFHPEHAFHQDFMRVIAPTKERVLAEDWSGRYPGFDAREVMATMWDSLPTLQTVFTNFYQSLDNRDAGYRNQQNADMITETLKGLTRL